MPVDPLGATFAVAGLLLAFKGAVDGYLLIESFFDNDSGFRDLALSYHIERCVLEDWGDLHNVYAEDFKDCRLSKERPSTQKLVRDILVRIYALHGIAETFLERHGDGGVQTNQVPEVIEQEDMQPGSAKIIIIAAVRRIQRRERPKRQVLWSIKNKDKFGDVVSTLRQYNYDLIRILTPKDESVLESTLPSYVLANLNDDEAMAKLRDLEGDRILLSHASKVKLMQKTLDVVPAARSVPEEEINPRPVSIGKEQRSYGKLHFKSIWIEWRPLQNSLRDDDRELVRKRIYTLSGMLCALTIDVPSLRVPQHVGIVEHDEQNANDMETSIGLIYAVPTRYAGQAPVSLLDIISQQQEPPLGEKFKLAAALASSLAMFHASNWLHKAFRSDNILLFNNPTDALQPQPCLSLTEPFITGFDVARPAQSASIDLRPTGKAPMDYYYHPDVSTGASKVFDWYSFGVMLLEIAYWKPLSTTLEEDVPLEQRQDLRAIREVFSNALAFLPALTGLMYHDVVRTCLECSLPAHDDNDMAQVVATDIIQVLTRLQA